jgi:hypothetical protein
MIFCIPCLALLLYFVIAGIFFPRYRIYVKEGLRCFLDKLSGKKCSISFDNRMRLALSVWLTKRGMAKLGRFFYNKKNFDLVLTIIIVILTLISIYLFILWIQFLINPPCGVEDTCSL